MCVCVSDLLASGAARSQDHKTNTLCVIFTLGSGNTLPRDISLSDIKAVGQNSFQVKSQRKLALSLETQLAAVHNSGQFLCGFVGCLDSSNCYPDLKKKLKKMKRHKI